MAAYTQFGYGGYPSVSQLLTANLSQSPQAGDSPNTPNSSSMPTSGDSGTNVPSLSPSNVSECRLNTGSGAGSGNIPSGAMSPDAISQNSSNTAGGTGAIANPIVDSNFDGSGITTLSAGGASGVGGSCCENGRPIMADPVSGQTVCSCQYDSARLALSSYPRLPAAGVGVYGSPYPSTDQNPYQSIGVDNSAFYSPLSNPYALKDSATGTEMTAWTSAGLQSTTGYYSYDPMSAYGYGPSYDLAARRKNATRESTATLKAWLNEHKKNPYPTKGEKIMLAIITKMTLTQVSTWFANARRRLKKENKMTWEPKNRTDDDDEAMVSDDEKEKDDLESERSSQGLHGSKISSLQRNEVGNDGDDIHDDHESKPLGSPSNDVHGIGAGDEHGGPIVSGYQCSSGLPNNSHGYYPFHHQHSAYYQHQPALLATGSYQPRGMPSSINNNNNIRSYDGNDSKNQLNRDCGGPIPTSKPKIWSLADTVACKTPPPANATGYMGQAPQNQQHQQQPQTVQKTSQQSHLNKSDGVTSHMVLLQQEHQHGQTRALPAAVRNYAGTPYSRVPPTTAYGCYLGPTMQQLPTTSSTPYSISASNSNSSQHYNYHYHTTSNINNAQSITHTYPTNIPIPANTTTQKAAAISSVQAHPPTSRLCSNNNHSNSTNTNSPHHPYVEASRGVGFPEAQPDTPPQTPPNMKLQSVTANILLTASQVPMIANCSNNANKAAGGNRVVAGSMGISAGGCYGTVGNTPHGYAMNSTRFDVYSPRDENSSGSSSCSSGASSQNIASYKAPCKSQIKITQPWLGATRSHSDIVGRQTQTLEPLDEHL